MAWLPRPDLKADIITKAKELKQARENGSCEWILKAAGELDALLDKLSEEKVP